MENNKIMITFMYGNLLCHHSPLKSTYSTYSVRHVSFLSLLSPHSQVPSSVIDSNGITDLQYCTRIGRLNLDFVPIFSCAKAFLWPKNGYLSGFALTTLYWWPWRDALLRFDASQDLVFHLWWWIHYLRHYFFPCPGKLFWDCKYIPSFCDCFKATLTYCLWWPKWPTLLGLCDVTKQAN